MGGVGRERFFVLAGAARGSCRNGARRFMGRVVVQGRARGWAATQTIITYHKSESSVSQIQATQKLIRRHGAVEAQLAFDVPAVKSGGDSSDSGQVQLNLAVPVGGIPYWRTSRSRNDTRFEEGEKGGG